MIEPTDKQPAILSHPIRSQSKSAVYFRTRRLVDDEFSERTKAQRLRRDGLKKSAAIKRDAHSAVFGRSKRAFEFSESFLSRIRFHLSKGRDAGDIAIRERMLVSDVVRAISHVHNPVANPAH